MLYWHAGSAIHWVKSSPPLRQALEWLLSGLKWNMVRVKIWQGISCGLCHQKEEEKLIHAFTIINLAVLDGCHVLWICINPIMSLSEFLPLRLAGIPCAHNALSCPLIFYHYSHYAAKKKGRDMLPRCIYIGMEQHSSAFNGPSWIQLCDWLLFHSSLSPLLWLPTIQCLQ